MGTADRLYELACECRDADTRLDKLVRDAERLGATRRAALELADALEGVDLPERAAAALSDLRALES